MHAEAERTERYLLPAMVAAMLDRNDNRREARQAAWRELAEARARQAAYNRFTAATRDATERTAERGRSVGADGLEV